MKLLDTCLRRVDGKSILCMKCRNTVQMFILHTPYNPNYRQPEKAITDNFRVRRSWKRVKTSCGQRVVGYRCTNIWSLSGINVDITRIKQALIMRQWRLNGWSWHRIKRATSAYRFVSAARFLTRSESKKKLEQARQNRVEARICVLFDQIHVRLSATADPTYWMCARAPFLVVNM